MELPPSPACVLVGGRVEGEGEEEEWEGWRDAVEGILVFGFFFLFASSCVSSLALAIAFSFVLPCGECAYQHACTRKWTIET